MKRSGRLCVKSGAIARETGGERERVGAREQKSFHPHARNPLSFDDPPALFLSSLPRADPEHCMLTSKSEKRERRFLKKQKNAAREENRGTREEGRWWEARMK